MMEDALGPIVDGGQPADPQRPLMNRDAPEPIEQRRSLVKDWQDRVTSSRQYWEDKAFKQMRKDMAFASGKQWPEDSAGDMYADEVSERYVANVTLRHIQARTASIYGKNPRIVAKRKERLMSTVWDGNMASLQTAMEMQAMGDPNAFAVVADAMNTMQHNRDMTNVAKTLELLFQHELDEQPVPFKVQMKATVRRGLTTSVGFVKLGYQRVMQHRPEITGQMHDIKARLSTIERLSADLADGEVDPNAAEAEELRLTMQSLGQTDQIVVREGLSFSYPDSTSIIPDRECKQLRGFVGASWVAEEFFLTSDRIKEIYKVDVKSGAKSVPYREKSSGGYERQAEGVGDHEAEYFCVWEIYNKDDGLVYTLCDGYADFLLEPSTPDVYLERFWPWFAFVVNEVYADGAVYPPSDVALMRDMQMELNRARQGLREHRRASRPKTFARKGVLEESDKAAITECKANEVIELQGLQPNEDIRNVLQAYSGPEINPNLYDPSPSYEDYMRVLGQHEASLGGASGATATEVSVAEGSRASTASAVVDDLDEFLTELARAGGQILLTEASPERVKEVVGPGAVWPDLSREDAAKEIYLDVEAASTGRPNQAQQVQAAQQIFPMLMQIPGVSPEWMARELLRRLDDKVDLTDAFAASMPSVMMMNRMQQMAGPDAQGQGNAPADQGAEGANNAPDTAPPQANVAPRPDAGQAQMNPI